MKRACFAGAALVLAALCSPLHAAEDYAWAAPASGDWDQSAKWTPNGVPGDAMGDTVTIAATGAPYVVTHTGSDIFSGLTLNSSDATLFCPGKVMTVVGPVDLLAGTAVLEGAQWQGMTACTNAAEMVMQGVAALYGTSFAQQGTFIVEGISTWQAEVQVGPDLVNTGLVQLTSAADKSASLRCLGTIRNQADGLIESLPGAGGMRVVLGHLENAGTLALHTDTWFNQAGTTVGNDGFIEIYGCMGTFSGTAFQNRTGGAIVGSGLLDVSGTTFTNAGTVAPGLPAVLGGPVGAAAIPGLGELVFVGPYTETETASVAIDIVGPLPGDHDAVSATNVTLAGTLALDAAFYTPALGETWRVMNYGARSGLFKAVTGMDLTPDLSLAVTYEASGVDVTAAMPGDVNLDGNVDTGDYFIMADYWFRGGDSWAKGDLTGDGVCDTADYFRMADHWFGRTVGATGGAGPLPEPATLALAALGLAGLLRRR